MFIQTLSLVFLRLRFGTCKFAFRCRNYGSFEV